MLNKTTYSPAVLAEAVWPHATLVRDVLLVVTGSLLIALAAQIAVPWWPVPLTGQTFAVLLVGATLGSRRGAASLLTYLGMGAAGLPVFAPNKAGLINDGVARFAGPTGGYLIGFLVAAFVVGWLCERGWDRHILTAAAAMLIGNVIIYLFGLPWLAQFTGIEGVFANGLIPFIPGDLAKLVMAALALPAGWALVNRNRQE
jgi:biotin transport system substrate-specific component